MSARSPLAAILVVLVLSVPAANVQAGGLPVSPGVPSATPALNIDQGGLTPSQGYFADNNSTMSVSVRIFNNGTNATNVPVFSYPEVPTWAGYTSANLPFTWASLVNCRVVPSINGVGQDGSPSVTDPIPVSLSHPYFVTNFTSTTAPHEPIHNLTYRIIVNALPPNYSPAAGSQCADTQNVPRTYTWATGSTDNSPITSQTTRNGNSETNLTDNVAFVRIVYDEVLVPTITSIRWCQGSPGNGRSCHAWTPGGDNGFNVDTNVTNPNAPFGPDPDFPWNIQRNVGLDCVILDWTNTTQSRRTTEEQNYCPSTGQPNNDTFFEVNVSYANSVIWHVDPIAPWTPTANELRNLGAPECRFRYPVNGAYSDTPPGASNDPAASLPADLRDVQDIQLNETTCPIFDPGLRIHAAPAGVDPFGAKGVDITSDDWWKTLGNIPASLDNGDDHHSTFDSAPFTLVQQLGDPLLAGWAALHGDWHVEARVPNAIRIAQPVDAVTSMTANFHIAAPDFTASFNDFAGASPATAISYSNGVNLPPLGFTVTVKNLGDSVPVFFNATTPTQFTRPLIAIHVALDNSTNPAFVKDLTWDSPGNSSDASKGPASLDLPISLADISSDPSSAGYVRPGLHGLCVTVGGDGNVTSSVDSSAGTGALIFNTTRIHAWNDSNPANNKVCSAVYFNDNSKPVLHPIPIGSTQVDPRLTFGAFNDPAINGIDAGETFYAHANASDSDQAGLKVRFTATLLNGTVETNVTRSFDPCPGAEFKNATTTLENCVHVRSVTPTDGSGLGYSATITNFTFSNATTTGENWTFTVHAIDAFGAEDNATLKPFKLLRWPIQTQAANNTLLGLCDASFSPSTTPGDPQHCTTFANDSSRISYATMKRTGQHLQYTIQVFDNSTGIDDQWNHTTNLGWNLTVPTGPAGTLRYTYSQNGSNWIHPSDCTSSPSQVPGRKGPTVCPDYSYLQTPDLSGDVVYADGRGGPGQYNFSAIFRDQAGQVRSINKTFFIYDEPPRLSDWKINESQVLPGQPLHLHVNVTDDFAINQTYANFTRVSDNLTFSIPLVNSTPYPQGTLPADQLAGYQYNDTITTGHGKTLGVAGNYSVRFWALDSFGNWNGSDPLRVLVQDTSAPVLTDAGADATSVQEGENITFHATAIDASNETVVLQILLGSEEVKRVNMTEDLSNLGNFTYTTNFTRDGSYTYNVWAIDSVNLESSHFSKTFAVRQNNPPNFDVKEPHTIIDGVRYGKAASEIKVLVHDPDNVSLQSITLSVGGVDITSDVWTYTFTTDPKGILVDYFIPQSQKFHDGDVVEVWMNATDMSNQTLSATYHFNYTVDDVPPTTVMLPLDPKMSYRADPRNVMNVSADTLFSLSASDDGAHPTGVASIQYQVCPLLCSGALAGSPYQGPFKLRGLPAYTGPRIYEIDYWSYDDVGNTNRSPERMLVYVDDLPPFLDPFGSVPQGRFINATFGDDRSGVASAVVWWRLNGAPYQPTALDFASGVWSTILPEGRKGDTMQYYLQATDRVGNTATFGNASNPYSTFVVGNHLPDLKITSPVTGSTIGHSVQIKWDAFDQDGDPLTFEVLYKTPGKSFVELQKLDSSDARSYVLDSTKLADGEYTFRVTANDGSFVAVSEITVNVLNSATPVRAITLPTGSVSPGEPILITAEITKAGAFVEARVYRDGTYIGNYTMNDAGQDGDKVANDGVYSTTVRFDASGTYTVEIHTVYQEQGQLVDKTQAANAPFTVRLTPAGVFNQFGSTILIVGLLAVAGIGIAAWVLIRRR